jgi:hypothetical protein
VLLEKGASPEVRDRKYHMTPADWAKKYKRYQSHCKKKVSDFTVPSREVTYVPNYPWTGII